MSILSKKLLTLSVLNEADSKYGFSDDVISGISDGADEELETGSDPADTVVDTSDPALEQETEVGGDVPPEDGGEGMPIEDDPTSPADEAEESGMDEFSDEELGMEGDLTEEDVEQEAQGTPGLRILSTISDSQYKLCNASIMEKFSKLSNEIRDTINNTIMAVRPNNDRDVQALDIVHHNLENMTTDIQNYVLYTFSDTYETNVVAYVSFLKRYRIAMQIVEKITEKKDDDKDGNNKS